MLKPSNVHVPVLVWVDTSTNFGALGLISTRTSNQSEHLHFRHGQFRRTGEKEFGPGKTATAIASTQMAQMAAVIALRSRMEHKLVQALIRARMIWITEFSLWKEPFGQPSIAVSCASTVTSNSRNSSGMSQQSGGCWRSSNQPHLVSTG